MKNNKNSRRQFLKNTTYATLTLGMLPTAGKLSAVKKDDNGKILECEKTTLDYFGEGPFYTEDPPLLSDNKLADDSEPGKRMIISGRVYNSDCTKIIPDTLIDIWHANDAGEYDNSGYNLRGQLYSNDQGFYMFETVYPGKYLNGSTYRPAHIHFKITPPGSDTLTTQLYFEGDSELDSDPAASKRSGQYNAESRIIGLSENNDSVLEGTWDIVLDAEGVYGINDIYHDKGMIYNTSPNPFTDKLLISYGVFHQSKVGIDIFDLKGRQVANLGSRTLKADKYEAEWIPNSDLPKGHYFVAIKINDMQVHYQKVIKV